MLAVATMTHVLLTSARRRRRDLAMLKALGLVRRQVLGVVEWQAVTLAATALLFGVPLGLLAGRLGVGAVRGRGRCLARRQHPRPARSWPPSRLRWRWPR